MTDAAVCLALTDPPRAEEVPAREQSSDSDMGNTSPDQSTGMAPRLPPVQPFPLASKDSSRFDDAPIRASARADVGRNLSDKSNGLAGARLPAVEQPSMGRRIFRSVASFFIMAMSAVLTSIVVSSALQSHGHEAKEMVMIWGSSLGGSSSAWQSRGDEAKKMVKEAWTSSLDWLMKKLPPDVDIVAKQKSSSPASQVSTRTAAPSTSVADKPAPVAGAVPFESAQQLKSMAQDLTAVRQKLVQLNATQQQMAQK